jgi:hypothetical protein
MKSVIRSIGVIRRQLPLLRLDKGRNRPLLSTVIALSPSKRYRLVDQIPPEEHQPRGEL